MHDFWIPVRTFTKQEFKLIIIFYIIQANVEIQSNFHSKYEVAWKLIGKENNAI